MKSLFKNELHQLSELINQINVDQLEQAAQLIRKTPGKLMILGNGGSNGVASHMAEDYTNNFKPALCFSDPAFMSCFANDYGWEQAYLKWLTHFALPGDSIILLSSSGASQNILNCAKWSVEKGFPLITLSGFSADNPLRKIGDIGFYVSSNGYKNVELTHAAILHTVLEVLVKTKEETQ